MIRRLLMVPIAALMLFTTGSGASASDPVSKLLADRSGMTPLPMPSAASPPTADRFVVAPGENQYWPLGDHGQAYYLSIDSTINWTDVLNRSYYNPNWRGETWAPWPIYWIVERQCRLMGLWREYDQENVYNLGTKGAQWLEKYSGFGP